MVYRGVSRETAPTSRKRCEKWGTLGQPHGFFCYLMVSAIFATPP